jgi:hypothetical protein
VEHDGGHEAGLAEPDDRVLVRPDHRVVRLRRDPDERGVEHVDEQEEEDEDAGDPVRDPRPHALPAAVQRAYGRLRHDATLLGTDGDAPAEARGLGGAAPPGR